MPNSNNDVEKIKKDIKDNLGNIFPNCKISINGKRIVISGVLILLVEDKIIDRYLIEIEMPDMKKIYYPVVKEIGNKIPRIADRHINIGGTTCLFYPDNYKKYYNQKTKLSEFIKGPVFTYFIAQTYFEITGIWIFGELNHNEIGAYEFYSQKFKIKDPQTIVIFLNFLLKKFSIKKNQFCACGNLKKFKNCHYRKLVKIKREVPLVMIENSVKKIAKFVDGLKNYADNQRKFNQVIAYIRKDKNLLSNIFYNEKSVGRLLSFFEKKFPPRIYYKQ